MECRLLAEYETDLDLIEVMLATGQVEIAAALASVPELICGFGHVKEANAKRAAEERRHLLSRLEKSKPDRLPQATEKTRNDGTTPGPYHVRPLGIKAS